MSDHPNTCIEYLEMLSAGSRRVTYLPDLRSVINRIRPLSSGINEPVGLTSESQSHIIINHSKGNDTSVLKNHADNVSRQLLLGRLKNEIIRNPVEVQANLQMINNDTNNQLQSEPIRAVSINTQTSPEDIKQAPIGSVECIIQEVPPYIHNSFMDLFPGISCDVGELNVLALCQRCQYDSSVYSDEMTLEREKMLINFISASTEIVGKLSAAGYWANFVDPASGRAFLGTYCDYTFFETDERYRHLGFRIEDLGCCKALSHRYWGTNVFVGSIFTNCPIDSPLLRNIFTEGDDVVTGK